LILEEENAIGRSKEPDISEAFDIALENQEFGTQDQVLVLTGF
jgi:hypothetical protein